MDSGTPSIQRATTSAGWDLLMSERTNTGPVLDVRNLKTQFFTRAGVVYAVDDVSFQVGQGETLGIVGESGCGKSVTSLSIMRLIPNPPGRIVGGQVLLNTGKDVKDLVKLSDR